VAGFCRHGNKRTASIRDGNILSPWLTVRVWKLTLTKQIVLYLGGTRLNLGREIDYPEYFHAFPLIF
jgi:hypothetical protein